MPIGVIGPSWPGGEARSAGGGGSNIRSDIFRKPCSSKFPVTRIWLVERRIFILTELEPPPICTFGAAPLLARRGNGHAVPYVALCTPLFNY